MNTHQIILVVHLLAASIWVGGHLILCIGILPGALKRKSPEIITQFELKYEKLGLPALLLLVITGIWLTSIYSVNMHEIVTLKNSLARLVALKLFLLAITLLLAVHARLFLIPRLTAATLHKLAWHIVCITMVGVAMLVTGSFARFGGI